MDEERAWYADMGLDEENANMVASKGWKDLNGIVKSYGELEKRIGADKNSFIKIPKAEEGKETDYSEVWARLGRPENADGYELSDSDFAKAARDILFKNGITNSQAKALEQWVNEYTQGYQRTAEESMEANRKVALENLKKNWGADFDENIALTQAVTKEYGITNEQLDAMGDIMGADKFADMLLSLAKKTDANKPLTGYRSAGGETKEMARAKVEELKSDAEFMKRLSAGDEKAAQEMLKWAALTVEGA